MTGSIYYVSCGSYKMYIGKTCDEKLRSWDHRGKLRCQRHHCKELQKDYNKNGDEYFLFRILEENIPKEILSDRENWWMRHFKGMCYNIHNNTPLDKNVYIPKHTTLLGISKRKPVEELLDGKVVAEYASIYECKKIRGLTNTLKEEPSVLKR
jgi:group I intron endonuclease